MSSGCHDMVAETKAAQSDFNIWTHTAKVSSMDSDTSLLLLLRHQSTSIAYSMSILLLGERCKRDVYDEME